MDLKLIDRLLGYDHWATVRIFELAGTLDDEQLDRQFDIGHRTVRGTLEHIVWNVECWTCLMKGNGILERPNSHQPIHEISNRYAVATAQFVELARELVRRDRLNETFVDTYDDPPRRKSFGAAIIHIATHGMHHRAQLLVMLRRLGLGQLPELDALTWEQATTT